MTSVKFVADILKALTELEIPFMLVGSFSSNFYGTPRSTKDADFVVQLDHMKLPSLVARLKDNYQFEEQMSFETITSTMRYRLRHRQSAFMVELFELSSDSHNVVRFARRVAKTIFGQSAFLPTPEDVIITKLRWSKGGNRQKDIDDVRNVLAVQMDQLDFPYIRQWCDQHGTRELLDALVTKVKTKLSPSSNDEPNRAG